MTAAHSLYGLDTDAPILFDLDAMGAPGPVPAGSFGATSALTQALYLQESGDTAAISLNDIHQGQLGDCFLLSPMGELALRNSASIKSMIHDNGNGTETVTLYLDRSGKIPLPGAASLVAHQVTVNNTFSASSVNNAGQDVVGKQQEIWAQVLEKAVATLEGGYGAIANGGNPAEAMEELTGKVASTYNPASVTAAMLTSFAAAGDMITFDTSSKSGLGYNLVSGHAYMFEKVNGSGSTATVQLGNPWGVDQPAAIPVAQFAKNFVEIDVGRTA